MRRKRHPLGAFIGGAFLLALGSPGSAIPPNTAITNTATATFDVDGYGYSSSASATLTTSAGSGNSSPSDVSIDPATVDENLAGVAIGLLAAADSDVNDSHVFSVADPRFAIVANELRLAAGQSLDFEATPTVTITVTATDSLGASISRDLVITVNDVNEAPTDIALGGSTIAGGVAGAGVGAVSVADPDAGDSHSYVVDDARFEVVAGQLKLVDGISLPLGTVVTLQITATDTGGLSYSRSFTLTAGAPGPGAGAAVSFAQFAPGAAGAAGVDVSNAQCDAGSGYQNLGAVTRLDGTPIAVPGMLELLPANVFKSGAAIFMQVTDADADLDPGSIDAVQVSVTTASGDDERLRILETGVHTGVFVGYAQSAGGPVSVGDCVIDTRAAVTVTYIDAADATDTATASALVDPAGLVFFSATGQPVSDARITLIDAATGLPATVFADNGVDAFPAAVTSGGSAVDAAGRVYDFADGAFRYPFVAAGDYVLLVDPPNRFVFPSAIADAALQLLPGGPFALGPGSRGNAFTVPVGPAMRVDIPLDVAPIVPTTSTLELLSLSPGNPAAALETVPTSGCFSNGAFSAADPPTDQRGMSVAVPASLALAPAQRFAAGAAIFVRLTDLDQDVDPFARDVVSVDVSVPGQADVERLQLQETAVSSGVFVGYLQTSTQPVTANDCRLGAEPGSSVEFSYVDAADSGDAALATALFDPGFTVFSSLTGAPVDGVQITLVDAATGLPATGAVFSADGITPFPATVTSGGSVTDTAGNTLDFAPGSFRFPVVLPGSYRFEAVVPAGMVFPSAAADADLAGLPGGPYVLLPGSRGNDFDVLAGIPPAFDIPLDPASADVFLTKLASKEIAAIGDFVQYQVVVQNSNLSSIVSDLAVIDRLPKGFRFVPGSARLNAAAVADPHIGPDGRSLEFAPVTLLPGEGLELRYVTEITVGAEPGRARNEATARGSGVGRVNVAFAEVTVREDLLRDKAIVMGRVLEGSCAEPGLATGMPAVRVFLEDGSYVVTDAQGRYHFEGIEPGSHVVQLDVGSVPTSHQVETCESSSRFAGSGYSQFVDVQGGTVWRADFYVARKPDQITDYSGRLRSEVGAGGIHYRYEVTGGALDVHDVTSVVTLPESLSYVAGSTLMNGRPAADPTGSGAGQLQFALPARGADAGAGFLAVLEFDAAVLDPRDEIVVSAATMFESAAGKHRTPAAVNEFNMNWPVSVATLAETRAYFGEAQTRLAPRELAKLTAIRERLAHSDAVNLQVRVVGHADSKPVHPHAGTPFADNQALSEARAAAVARLLREQLQLSEERVVVAARGASDPLADNATEAGRTANRRVDIAIVGEVFEPTDVVQHADSGIVRLQVVTDRAQADALPYEIPEVDDGAAPAFDLAWLKGEAVENALVWPRIDYNPRIPSITVAVKHQVHLQPRLLVAGQLVEPMTFAGLTTDRPRGLAVSVWDNVSIREGNSEITVHFLDDTGHSIASSSRRVHFAGAPVRAELVGSRSYLLADGITPPLLAVRLFDREGFPARPGLTGEFTVAGNYQAYDTVRELDQLDNGMQQGYQRYQVREDGIAFIRLEPTPESGEVRLDFDFGEHRTQTIRARLKPGVRDWILVGLAEGVVGYNELSGNLRSLDEAGIEEDLLTDGRVAFYAKGQIKGSWLLTTRYDTDKATEQRLRQQIDPNRFYTLYGDGTQQRYDAESRRRLYLKLEREEFAGLFGDFDTGLDSTEFTRYARSLNGLQGNYYGDQWEISAFASETEQGYFRDEIRGDGTSGTYRLSNRRLLANSERVRIVTRDRYKTEQILEQIALTRYLDYSIDYDAGTLIFKQPVFSQDHAFNPIFIEVEYEVAAPGVGNEIVAGTRIARRLDDADSEIALTYVDDGTAGREGDLIGMDLNWDVTPATRVKAEAARTDTRTAGDGNAYLLEIARQGNRLAGRAYYREQDGNFGLGQQTALNSGMVKIGVEGDYRLSDQLQLRAETFKQHDDITGSERLVAASKAEYRLGVTRLAAGVRSVREDVSGDDTDRDADQLTLGASRSVLNNRLLLRGDAELNVDGGNNADYPSRAIVGAEYAIGAGISLLGEQEFSFGDLRDTRDTRVGAKARPWRGADLNGTVQRQRTENSERLFATTGLLQQLRLNERWTFDLGVDRVQTLKRSGTADDPEVLLYNPRLPPVTGSIDDDFSAFFAGFAYRHDNWDVSSRIERHDGDRADKWNYLLGASHQLADGKVMSASVSLLTEQTAEGSERNQGEARLGVAWRPLGAAWLYLDRLDLVFDRLVGNGFDTRTRKFVNNFNANYRPNRRNQLSVQLGMKYVVENIDADEYDGFTGLYGLEYRHSLGPRWDWGLRGAALHSFRADLFRYSAGISLGYGVFHNAWASLGYNLLGFEDDDFFAADYTARGPYLKLRMKVDQDSLRRFLEFAGWRSQAAPAAMQ